MKLFFFFLSIQETKIDGTIKKERENEFAKTFFSDGI
jgi:hypothetical protein